MQTRLKDSEKHATKAEDALIEAEKAAGALEPKQMEEHLDDAKRFLAEEDAKLYPEYELLQQRLIDGSRRLPAVQKQREERDLAEKGRALRDSTEGTLAEYRRLVANLDANDVTVETAELTKKAEVAVREALADGAALDKVDPGWTQYSAGVRALLEKQAAVIALAQARALFRAGPGVQKAEAAAWLSRAKATRATAEKLQFHQEALTALASCQRSGEQAIKSSAGLARARVLVDQAETTPEATVAWCQKQQKPVSAQIAKLKPLVKAPKKK